MWDFGRGAVLRQGIVNILRVVSSMRWVPDTRVSIFKEPVSSSPHFEIAVIIKIQGQVGSHQKGIHTKKMIIALMAIGLASPFQHSSQIFYLGIPSPRNTERHSPKNTFSASHHVPYTENLHCSGWLGSRGRRFEVQGLIGKLCLHKPKP